MADLNPLQFGEQHLFDPASIPEKQPHQMGIDEFARQPGTWWHASATRTMDALRGDYDYSHEYQAQEARRNGYSLGDPDWSAEGHVETGFHVGTVKAAADRVVGRASSFFHPVKITGAEFDPAQEMEDRGDDWDRTHHGRTYVNHFEDPGSKSAILASPHSVKTHQDFVREAQRTPGRIPSGLAEYDAEKQPSMPYPTVKASSDLDPWTGERIGRFERDFRTPLQKMEEVLPLPQVNQQMFEPTLTFRPKERYEELLRPEAVHPAVQDSVADDYLRRKFGDQGAEIMKGRPDVGRFFE